MDQNDSSCLGITGIEYMEDHLVFQEIPDNTYRKRKMKRGRICVSIGTNGIGDNIRIYSGEIR